MRMKRFSRLILFFLFLLNILLLHVWGQDKVRIKTENGVQVITNPEKPSSPPGSPRQMRITKELVIGKSSGHDEYMFGEVEGVAVDDFGRIFVLDSKQTLIRVFDRNGAYLKTLGRKGQGPGELQTPQHIFTTWQEEIMIEDHSPRQFVFFSWEGEFLRNVSFARAFIFTTGIDSGGNFIGIVQTAEPDGNVQVLSRYSPEFDYLHTVGYPIKGDRGTYNFFKPWLRWSVFKGDHVIFSFSERYELLVYDSRGQLVKKILKKYKPVKISEEELAYMRKVVRLPSTVRLIVPKNHTAFQRFTVDEKNRIFVQTWEKTEDRKGYIYDVFNSAGICIARVPLNAAPRVWKQGKLYTIEEDEAGYQYIVRYKVVWQ
jgi:hypothetical protein